MSKVLYQLFISLYTVSAKIISPFNQKAKLWVQGRRRVFERMQDEIDSTHPLIWIHCSSLGEFEQGRPLIEKIKTVYPGYKILLTFFSPSGYEVRKNYEGADYIFYLPADNNKNAKKFFELTKPKLILFIKYEFWYYYLNEAKRQGIPLLLVSAIFRKRQVFFAKYGSFHRSMLACFSHFFVQNTESLVLLSDIGLKQNVTISGDTRFDRVIEIAQQFQPIEPIYRFCADANVIVAGSTWSEDDKKLSAYANAKTDVKFIIAPHDISGQRLNECLKLYKNSALFSAIAHSGVSSSINTIIVDNVGMLSRLYKYSVISYVGGGFGKEGIHNVLEAAVFGKPVVFGPIYQQFMEAIELVDIKGAVSIQNYSELETTFNKLLNKDQDYENMCKSAHKYIYNNEGATVKILDYIQRKRLLTR